MKKVYRLLIAVCLSIVFIGMFANVESEAAALKLNTLRKTIFVNGSSVRPEYTDTYILKLKNKPKRYSVSWKSADESVATVEWMKSGKATVKAVGIGKCVISAYVHDKISGIDYILQSEITVKKNCSSVSIVPSSLADINVGEKVRLEGLMYDENNIQVTHDVEVTDFTKWVSDDPSVATVDEFGNVQGVSRGTTYIGFYATQTGTGAYSKPAKAVAVKKVKVNVVGSMLVNVRQTALNCVCLDFSDSVKDVIKPEDIKITGIGSNSGIAGIIVDETGCHVYVTAISQFSENVKYTVEWNDASGEFTATKGSPAKIELYTDIADNCVIAGYPREIKVRFYNEYGVDITPLTETSDEYANLMRKMKFSVNTDVDTMGDVFVTGNLVMFLSANKKAVVNGEFTDYVVKGDKLEEKIINASLAVTSVSEASTIVLSDLMITDSPLTGSKLDWSNPQPLMCAVGDANYRVVARFSDINGKYTYSDELDDKVTFSGNKDSINLAVFSNGALFAMEAGTGVIVVNYDGVAVGGREVAVVPARTASSIMFESDGKPVSSLTVSSNSDVSTVKLNARVCDQYGKTIKLNPSEVSGFTEELIGTNTEGFGPYPLINIDNDGNANVTFEAAGYGTYEGATFVYRFDYLGALGKATGSFVLIVKIPNDADETSYRLELINDSGEATNSFPGLELQLTEYKGEIANSRIREIYPINDTIPAVSDIYYYRVYDSQGKQVTDGTGLNRISLIYANKSLLKRLAPGEYKVKVYKGRMNTYLYVCEKSFEIGKNDELLKIEQISDRSSYPIYRNMTEEDIKQVFDSCFNVYLNGTKVPVSNITIADPVAGEKQIIFRNIKVKDYVTVYDVAYYFEYDAAVNRQVLN